MPLFRESSPAPSLRHVSRRRVNERESFLAEREPASSEREPLLREREPLLPEPMRQADSIEVHVANYCPAGPLGWRELLPYYFPLLSWAPEYSVSYFVGDLIAGVSLAAFQIPLAISYATSLAHVPISSALFSLGIAPLIYLGFGLVPQMIVGPEAPISLIVGQALEPLHHRRKLDPVEYVVAITLTSGATLLGFGLARFGFLDNILCELLLKGFICGVGCVMVLNASISMLGLEEVLRKVAEDQMDMDIHSPFDKLRFLVTHFKESHAFTLQLSLAAFASVWLLKRLKVRLSRRKPFRGLVYMPEILLVVVATTLMCRHYRWDLQIDIVGAVDDATPGSVVYNPFGPRMWLLTKQMAPLGFLCAMLGFFELTTASKLLGLTYDLPISSNRELVALGAINVAGLFVGALPAFGGYGRSKVNAVSAKTTMLGAIMGIIALSTLGLVMESLYYIPQCVLSVITAVIGLLLMSECPRELYFHYVSRGYDELFTFFITVAATLFYSMEAGICVGLVYLLLRVIRTSAQSRIQILGRVPGTNQFLDADVELTRSSASKLQLNLFTDNIRALNVQALEEVEGCLIIKIPEPLTFTNASDLRARLKRVERFGSTKTHPALKRSREKEMTKYIVFDLEEMAYLDSSAAHILKQTLQSFAQRRIRTFFVRVPQNPKLRLRLKRVGIEDFLRRDLAQMTGSELGPYFEHIRNVLHVVDVYEQGIV